MNVGNPLNAPENSLLKSERLKPSFRLASGFKTILFGSNGLRSGWRLAIYMAMVAALLATCVLVRSGGVQGFLNKQRSQAQITVTPALMASSEVIAFAVISLATWIMSRIERRRFSAYGLPLRLALRKDFWVGALCGFLAICGTLLSIFLLHGFRLTGLALHGRAILSAPAAWGVAFLLAGLTEEFLTRGYFQYTLAEGIGFWPAAFVGSALFALGHVPNANESRVGILSVVLFGLLFCLFLRRTGSLWCGVGFHAAWDWGQTLYGVPDSGILPHNSLFASAFRGPHWLTGGMVGPEASILTPIALLIVAVIFSQYYREDRLQIQERCSSGLLAR